MSPRRWTAADDVVLRELVALGRWYDSDIARIMCRCERTIYSRRKRMGLKPLNRSWAQSDEATLRRLVDEGKSDREIVQAMGWSLSAIRDRRRALGLKARGKGGGKGWHHSPETRAKISAFNRRRWDTAEYREMMDPVLKRMRETSMATRVRVPNTAYYRKLRRVLGAETARKLAASPFQREMADV